MRKLISFLATSAILLNSFYAPLTAIAQEMTPTPAPTPEATSTPGPSPEITPAPTEDPTPAPESTSNDIATPTPEILVPTPEASVEPINQSTDQPVATQSPESIPTTPGPPTETPTPETSDTPIATFTPVITDENAEVTTQIITSELFPETVQENSVVKLITDKLDYTPSEIAIISGSGFIPEKTYSLTVSSDDNPATSKITNITANEDGEFTCEYQLDGNYRPNYSVEVKDGEELIASTSFTDSSGAIWTTDKTCVSVNENVGYVNKSDVYLNGGPAGNDPGLPDGSYYVKVTEPDGNILGKSTSVAVVTGGHFISCYQLTDILYTASSSFTVKGYDTTGNPGGEYKVWVSMTSNFDNSDSKTDNFKVNPPQIGSLTIHKVDQNGVAMSSVSFTIAGASSATGLTDINGNLVFSGIPVGAYTVTESEPSNYHWTSTTGDCSDASPSNVTVTTRGQTCTFTNSVNSINLGTIEIKKIVSPHDTNTFWNFGIYDGVFWDTWKTDGYDSGPISVIAGKYNVVEQTAPGTDGTKYISTVECKKGDTTVATGGPASLVYGQNMFSSQFSVAGGQHIVCTFTNTKSGAIQGKKYEDLNRDGNWDSGESYLNDWTIRLFDSQWSPKGQMDTGDTGTQGQYRFTNLMPGTYYVCEDLKTGWKQTEPSSGQIRDGAYCRTETVGVGDVLSNRHFGNFELTYLQGRKYNDLDGNGQQDLEETELNDWTIRLYDSSWNQIGADQLTHFIPSFGEGRYKFENLDKGTYYICEVLSPGWVQTDPGSSEGVANQSQKPDEAPRCRTATISQSGTPVTGKVFGNAELSDIHGYKFNDLNGNGFEDLDEPKLSGWKIFIDTNGNQSWDGGETFMLTDSSQEDLGWYWFTNLMPGTYSVCEETLPGWNQTTSPTCHRVQLPYYRGENTCGQEMRNAIKTSAPACNFGNLQENPEIKITKSNNSGSGIGAGATVTYTLVVTNGGNVDLRNIGITDYLPGGFSYVTGTTVGDITDIASISPSGTTLTWNYPGTLAIGDNITFSYQVKTNTNLSNGTYTNFATCKASAKNIETTVFLADVHQGDQGIDNSYDPYTECKTTSSTVTIGNGLSYGGSLVGQVLGASTELPATGSPTMMLVASLTLIGSGLILNGFGKKERKTNVKK